MEKIAGSVSEMDHDALFEGLMQHVGLDGKFQSRFNYVFNLVFVVFLAMPYLNLVLAMTVPEHWCHSLELFDRSMEVDEHGKISFSKCRMYNNNPLNDSSFPEYNESGRNIVESARWLAAKGRIRKCAQELEKMAKTNGSRLPDDTDIILAKIAAKKEKIYDKSIVITNINKINLMSLIIEIGFRIGRRPVFFITLLMLAAGRCLSVTMANIYPLFLTTTILGSLSQSAAFQSPMGTNVDLRYPYIIMAFLFICSIFGSLFLPETLHHRLPETLQDAQDFGRDQAFWSFPKKEEKVRLENGKLEMAEVPLKS
ncbi:hypothetical protein C0J52_21768 [Blattella germanica]|nr:hypothetical protein C0J52_21768 [Blattella germanica]